MTTNFYFGKPAREFMRQEPKDFIGKRSGAGLFCWDCGVTLCIAGIDAVHYGRGGSGWYQTCPKCGQGPTQEGLSESPAGLELGFAEPRIAKPTGVRGCCSFFWHLPPETVRERIKAGDKVYDEYDRRTINLLDMIEMNCPIIFHDYNDGWC